MRHPTDPSQQLQWLVDRAAISDLLYEWARSLDDRQWDRFEELWTEDVVVTAPGVEIRGREAALGWLRNAEYGLASFGATHHMNTNHLIAIDGDDARARAYVLSAHLRDAARLEEKALAGGWWDYAFRRTLGGWRCASAALTVRWMAGTDHPGRSTT